MKFNPVNKIVENLSINEAIKPDGGDSKNYWSFYINCPGCPSRDQIEKFGKDHGCTIIWWGSDEGYGLKGSYNGDTLLVCKDINKLPSGYKEDAKKNGKKL